MIFLKNSNITYGKSYLNSVASCLDFIAGWKICSSFIWIKWEPHFEIRTHFQMVLTSTAWKSIFDCKHLFSSYFPWSTMKLVILHPLAIFRSYPNARRKWTPFTFQNDSLLENPGPVLLWDLSLILFRNHCCRSCSSFIFLIMKPRKMYVLKRKLKICCRKRIHNV